MKMTQKIFLVLGAMVFAAQAHAVLYLARPYEPNMARWTTRDPIGEAGGINLYGFGGNNPISRVDPFGLAFGDWWDFTTYSSGYAQGQGNLALINMLQAQGYNGMSDFQQQHPGFGGDIVSGNLDAVAAAANITGVAANGYVNGAMMLGQAGIVTKGTQVAAQGIADAAERGWFSKLWSRCKAPFKKSLTGLSPGARTEAKNLAEKLALQEAQAGAGTRIMQTAINDPNFPENVWAKMQWVHDNPDGTSTTIHYWQNLQTGQRIGFKFKDP
jgi:RHS repeat-associated protein